MKSIFFPLAAIFASVFNALAAPVYEPLAAFEAGPRRPGPGKNSGEANGGQGEGTVFKVNLNTGVLTTFQEFIGPGAPRGEWPIAGLVSDGNRFFWGTSTTPPGVKAVEIRKIVNISAAPARFVRGASHALSRYVLNDAGTE